MTTVTHRPTTLHANLPFRTSLVIVFIHRSLKRYYNNPFIMYSSSCCSKPVRLFFLAWNSLPLYGKRFNESECWLRLSATNIRNPFCSKKIIHVWSKWMKYWIYYIFGWKSPVKVSLEKHSKQLQCKLFCNRSWQTWTVYNKYTRNEKEEMLNRRCSACNYTNLPFTYFTGTDSSNQTENHRWTMCNMYEHQRNNNRRIKK